MIGIAVVQVASGTQRAIVHWNDNHGEDAAKDVIFHCSNLPKHFFENFRIYSNEIIATGVGKENAFGTVVGRLKSGLLTVCQASTDDLHGSLRAYVGEGEMTSDRLQSFRGYGVTRVPRLPQLLQHACKNGCEYHICVSLSRCGCAVAEALGKYKGWKV